jgi:hypothetical protein
LTILLYLDSKYDNGKVYIKKISLKKYDVVVYRDTEVTMSTKLSYSTFSLAMVRRQFALTMKSQAFFEQVPEIEPSAWLQESLRRAGPVALISEKARSEFIVAPILLEVKAHR